jgi:hypothetical protein
MRMNLGSLGLFPTFPVTALPSLLRIKPLAAEPLQEFIGVQGTLKTINVEPFPIVEHGMTSRAKRQILAEFVNLFVAAIFTTPRRQNYLVQPAPINCC